MVARRTVARWIVPQWWQARALAAGCAFALFGLAGCGSSQEGVSPPRATSSGVPGPVAAGLAECARQGAARLHPASYEIHFNVHVVPGGEARLVEVVSSTLGDRGLEECMKGAFRSVAWQAPTGALRPSGAEVGEGAAPPSRGLLAQSLPGPMGPTIAGPFNLFLRLGAGGTVAVAGGAVAGATAAGEAAAGEGLTTAGAAAAAGGAVIAGIGAFFLVFFYPSSIAADPPVASATSMPTTTTVPLPTVIPVGRRYPTQTCDDDELDRLEDEKEKLCKPKTGFAAKCGSKVNEDKKPFIPCSLILLSLQQRQACKAQRVLIQDKCFGGKPDAGHKTQIDDVQKGIDACEALKLLNCAKGHPMAGK